MENTLNWPLDHAVRLHAERPATLGGERPVTYRQLKRRIGGLGAGLERFGLGRGAVDW